MKILCFHAPSCCCVPVSVNLTDPGITYSDRFALSGLILFGRLSKSLPSARQKQCWRHTSKSGFRLSRNLGWTLPKIWAIAQVCGQLPGQLPSIAKYCPVLPRFWAIQMAAVPHFPRQNNLISRYGGWLLQNRASSVRAIIVF